MRAAVVVLVVLAVLAVGAVGTFLVVRPWGGGAEAVYSLYLPPDFSGTPKSAAEETARVLERRAAAMGLEAAAIAREDGRVRLRLAGLTTLDIDALRETFERKGRLELLAAADRETQERYNADGKLPAGFRVGRTEDLVRAPDYMAWSKGAVLLAEPAVVRTADVARAETRQSLDQFSVTWGVSIELLPEAAAAFDTLAARLHARRPPGLVAIVLDGRIVSMPVIVADRFGGKLQIVGAKDEREARAWAAVITGGELPCLLRPPEVGSYRGRLR